MTGKIEITPELLADLKEKAEKAMPGPWAYGTDAEKCGAKYPDTNRVYAYLHPQDDHVYGILLSVNHNLKLCDTTAAYIAAANPQAILELIADYERLEKENEELRANNYGPEILGDNGKLLTCLIW